MFMLCLRNETPDGHWYQIHVLYQMQSFSQKHSLTMKDFEGGERPKLSDYVMILDHK